jgi:hypothetical protein
MDSRLLDYIVYEPTTGIIRLRNQYNRSFNGSVAGFKDKDGYIVIGIQGKIYKAHRLAWLSIHGDIPDDTQVDHINGIKDDNRLCNLRLATRSQNKHNTRLQSNNTSGIKGLSFNRQRNKWVARVTIKGTVHHLGMFTVKATAEKVLKEFRETNLEEYVNHG